MLDRMRRPPDPVPANVDLGPDEVVRAEGVHKFFGAFEVLRGICSVSYTHLTLPTNREV